ncbi:hypothetical protein E2C01_078762 [Portunus trituberculatus]|uniref:Uncharacterized protein n=1 Tax=Portunus trituberculatus TaxID=210409 RepID=A0A5B7ITN7_PORTR|nr:hypothetical protein [Portunus trituberculatus]
MGEDIQVEGVGDEEVSDEPELLSWAVIGGCQAGNLSGGRCGERRALAASRHPARFSRSDTCL